MHKGPPTATSCLAGSLTESAPTSVWPAKRPLTLSLKSHQPPLLASAGLECILALGHGQSTAMESADALTLAAKTTGYAPVHVRPGMGFSASELVTVSATDYGVDPTTGTLVGLSNDSVTASRQDTRAGTVHVHFPRRGFLINRAG